jgi:hypothetical protein
VASITPPRRIKSVAAPRGDVAFVELAVVIPESIARRADFCAAPWLDTAMKLGRGLIIALSALALVLLVGIPIARRLLSRAAGPVVPRRVLNVEPAPVPEGLVFVGPEGDREDGWPRQSVDRTALLALLRAGRHRDLTEQLESLQATFEADPRRERWINEAMLAFRQADPALDAPIDAWVAAEPASFAPFLARCAHLDAVAWERRGTRTVAET